MEIQWETIKDTVKECIHDVCGMRRVGGQNSEECTNDVCGMTA